jgi:NhaA family Na+:H+ antiporter
MVKLLIRWIKDRLTAIVCSMIGLEPKHELFKAEPNNPRDVILSGMAGLTGMAVPAQQLLFFNTGIPPNASGCAIPAATDIALALGVLAPKVFRLSLAIHDDPGAFIIAPFFTAELTVDGLVMVLNPLAAPIWLNRKRLARMPAGATWAHVQSQAGLAGIGFTISVFGGPVVPAVQGDTVVMLSTAKVPVP